MITRHRAVRCVPLGVLVLIACLGPALAPYDPQAPLGDSLATPSAQHLLGTTSVGQDVLSRILHGAGRSVGVSLGAAGGSVALGAALGITAGLMGRWPDALITSAIDIVLSLPRLPLLVFLASVASSDALTVVIVLTCLGWAGVARVVRAQTVVLRHAGYLQVSAALGAGRVYLARRHLIPELLPIIASQAVAAAAGAILVEATLAFLGLAPTGSISWGADLNRTLTEPGVLLSDAWLWWALPTGLAVVAACAAFLVAGTAFDTPAVADRVTGTRAFG